MDSIKTDFVTGPVTALLVKQGFVLAGIAGNVVVYCTQKKKAVSTTSAVLPCRNIHGLVEGPNTTSFCSFGEKCFRICNLSNVVFCSSPAVVLEDWILDIAWIHEKLGDDFKSIAAALAHNVVVLWDTQTSSVTHRVDCVEKCILYCACFLNTSWEDLILAAGTVFNQIVLWAPMGPSNTSGERQVLHRLKSHEGVIFSVDYHPKLRLLASVSDDRTIRIWSLSFPSNTKCPSVSDWALVKSSLNMTLYGHSARVWDINLLDDIFISVGEDASCIVWDYTGKIQHKFKGHKGKSIWSLASDKHSRFVVTGGGDGSIRMWMLESGDGSERGETTQHPLSIVSSQKVAADDFPRSIAIADHDSLLLMTNQGYLLKYTTSGNLWTLVYHDKSFVSYTLMTVSPDRKLVAIGNIYGTLKIFWIETCQECCASQLYEDKVLGLSWLDNNHLLTSGPQGSMYLLSVPSLEKLASLSLPVCKQRWATAGVIYPDTSILVCGDRGGTVHCYDFSQEAVSDPVSSFSKIHGKAGVTDMCYHGRMVFTSGRDGHYRQWELVGGDIKLRSAHKVMKGMDWIGKLQVTDDDILVYGFLSSRFVLWSVNQNLCLMSVECGGGHRGWDCILHGHSAARLVYLKAKDVIVCDTRFHSHQILLKPSLHGRELCDTKHLATYSTASGAVHLVATCSEDTTVQLLSIAYESGCHLRVLHTLQGHLSSVRTMALSCHQEAYNSRSSYEGQGHTKKRELILFSGGGRAQIQVWRINITSNNRKTEARDDDDISLAGDVREDCHYEHLACVFLSGTTWRGGCVRAANQHQSDPETRIMCLNALCLRDIDPKYPPSLHVVAAACSDAYVRVFGFNTEDKMLTLLHLSSYHGNCVLKVSLFSHQLKIILLSGATDGCIAFWDISDICKSYVEVCTTARTSVQDHISDSFENCVLKNPRQPGGMGENLRAEHTEDIACSATLKIHMEGLEDVSSLGSSKDSLVRDEESECSESCESVLDAGSEGADREVRGQGPNALTNCKTKSPPRSRSSMRSTCKILPESQSLPFSPVISVKVHQSGSNSLHCYPHGGHDFSIATGGDDNCLAVMSLALDISDQGQLEVNVKGILKNVSAHAAQITGVWMVSPSCVVSASIDQRICMWRLTEGQFKMVACRYIHFADVSSMDVWQDGNTIYLFVCGEGLAVLHIDT